MQDSSKLHVAAEKQQLDKIINKFETAAFFNFPHTKKNLPLSSLPNKFASLSVNFMLYVHTQADFGFQY